jgi:hypothetical protein
VEEEDDFDQKRFEIKPKKTPTTGVKVSLGGKRVEEPEKRKRADTSPKKSPVKGSGSKIKPSFQ